MVPAVRRGWPPGGFRKALMRWLCCVAALLLAATPAGAAGALYLDWNECPLDPISAQNRNSPCNGNTSVQTLVASFQSPANVDSVLGVDLVVDLQSAAGSLPSWWNLLPASPDSCRYGALTASLDFTLNTACEDFWLNQGSAVVQAVNVGPPRWPVSAARILASGSVPLAAGYRSLTTGSTYYAMKLVISSAHTVDPNGCPGCLTPVCLVLNSIAIRRQPGTVGGDVLVDSPGGAGANWATWQQGTGADCAAVPARRVTWGRIQSLFR